MTNMTQKSSPQFFGAAIPCRRCSSRIRSQRNARSHRQRAGAVHRHSSDHGRDEAAWWDNPGQLRHFGFGDTSGELHQL